MKRTLVRFIFFALSVKFSVCQTGTDLSNLWTQLFTTNNYNTKARPSSDQSVATQVTVDFYLAGISSLDDISEKLTTTGYLVVKWTDDYLTWTPATYGNIQEFSYPQGSVWKPDLSLQNGFTKMQELGSSFVNVNVEHTGKVTWEPFELFESRCSLDITFFPYDVQTCELVFVCWSYKPTSVNLSIGTNGFQLYEDFNSNGEWSVVSTSTDMDIDVSEIKANFKIKIKRKAQYFVLNIMIPVLMVSFLNLFTFIIPCDSGERTGYAITVWLTFAVFLTIVSTALPASATTTAVLAVYVMFMLVLATIVVMVSIVQIRVNGFSEEDHPIPVLLKHMVIKLKKKTKVGDKVNPERVFVKEINENETSEKGKENDSLKFDLSSVKWKDVISSLDFILFWGVLIIIIVVTIICFAYMAAG